jgi:mannose-6-phosphate isomerase-like protein (cupin superfamily)
MGIIAVMANSVSVDSAEHYLWGGNSDGWHLGRSGEPSVIQERVPPGGRETRHFHARARQFFFVLAGEWVLEADGRRHVLRAHTGLEVPPGLPHQFRNESEHAVAFRVISQPSSPGGRLPAESIAA